MDGNRRWAISKGTIPWLGHKNGWDAVKRVIIFCLEKNIEHLSLYTFSTENLNRSYEEKYYLFEVLAQEAFKEIDELKNKNVRVRFVGDRTLFPKSVKHLCEKSERETQHCTELYLNFLLCYGGQQEIVDTVKRIAIKVTKGDLNINDITPALFEHFLWTSPAPFPNLIIRTGGDNRLSNFLLYQCAYSELYFIDCLWPDISSDNLESAIIYYDNCRQNFGK